MAQLAAATPLYVTYGLGSKAVIRYLILEDLRFAQHRYFSRSNNTVDPDPAQALFRANSTANFTRKKMKKNITRIC